MERTLGLQGLFIQNTPHNLLTVVIYSTLPLPVTGNYRYSVKVRACLVQALGVFSLPILLWVLTFPLCPSVCKKGDITCKRACCVLSQHFSLQTHFEGENLKLLEGYSAFISEGYPSPCKGQHAFPTLLPVKFPTHLPVKVRLHSYEGYSASV